MSSAVQITDVTKAFGDVVAVDNISIDIKDGEFFSLLGPSGCGKTTTLRLIAGFEQPTIGQISIMGQPVAGVPAYRRPVNTVFQSYALFPHMTVAKNVAFGLEMAKVPADEIKKRVDAALGLVEMDGYGERRTTQMSGGQKQRVALARAIVNWPKVLLLDEPLGALDLKLRKNMQLELKQIQQELGITFIYVTHDQEEAITMSDRIAVMSDGKVQQIGPAREIYEQPNNRFVADFIGETNFINGEVIDSDKSSATLESAGVKLSGAAKEKLPTGQSATVAIRPEKISLSLQTGLLNTDNRTVTLDGTISDIIYIGTDTRYQVVIPTGDKLFVRVQNLGRPEDVAFNKNDKVHVQWLIDNAQVLAE